MLPVSSSLATQPSALPSAAPPGMPAPATPAAYTAPFAVVTASVLSSPTPPIWRIQRSCPVAEKLPTQASLSPAFVAPPSEPFV